MVSCLTPLFPPKHGVVLFLLRFPERACSLLETINNEHACFPTDQIAVGVDETSRLEKVVELLDLPFGVGLRYPIKDCEENRLGLEQAIFWPLKDLGPPLGKDCSINVPVDTLTKLDECIFPVLLTHVSVEHSHFQSQGSPRRACTLSGLLKKITSSKILGSSN